MINSILFIFLVLVFELNVKGNMYKTKLIQYLSQFSAQELQQFQVFVDSPYFNKHENTKALLNHILKVNNWESPALQKEKAFKVIFPKKKFDPQLLSNLISYLLKLLRRFLTQKQFEKRDIEQQLDLLENCFNRSPQKLFSLTAGQLQKEFEQSKIKDSNFYFQHNRFQRLLDDFDLQFGDRTSGEYLEKALEDFDVFFIGEKLKMTCQMLARKQVTANSFSVSLIEELIHFIEKEANTFKKIPSVWLYFLIYKMISNNDPIFYFQLKERLLKDSSFFKHQEGRDLYTHALNYCIQQMNFGAATFRKETFELYQQMLDNGLLFVEKIIPHWDFTNIVSLACFLGEYDWTKDFIYSQKEYLPKGEKENAFNYNVAAFHYNQEQYDEAIALLQEVEFTDVYYNLLTRILLLKIYFDSENWRTLEYSLETFRIYLLRNKKITDNRRKSGLNLIRFTKKLIRLVEQRKLISKKEYRLKLEQLKQQIEQKEMLLNKAWLLEKIEKLFL